MTVKSLRKQLAAAVAMTLVATVALGSSTYAWFAQNGKVTAKEVSVKAQTAMNLSISLDQTTWQTSVDFEDLDSDVWWPVSATDNSTTFIGNTATADLSDQANVVFYGILSSNEVQSADSYAADVPMEDDTLADADLLSANFSTAAAADNYWTDDIYLRYDFTAGSTAKIDAKVTVKLPDETTLETKDISKAFHVALVTADGKWYMGEVASVVDGAAVITFSEFVTLTANVPQLVKAYLWYEGEDTDCFTNAALAPKMLDTTFEFSLPAPAAAPAEPPAEP